MSASKGGRSNDVRPGDHGDVPATTSGTTDRTSAKGRLGAKVNNTMMSGSVGSGPYLGSYSSNMPLLESDDMQDYNLHLEELGSSGSDYSSEDSESDTIGITGRTADVFGISEPLTDRNKRELARMQEFEDDSDDDEYKALRQIALLEHEAEDFEIDSDEENDIMAEIRAEITEKVREEMKSELAVYQKAKENLLKDEKEEKPADDLEGLEPKLREAILKMRKLDKILAKKTKREKQVKRERLMLQKKLKEELLNIKRDPDKMPSSDEKKNTEKFMMLALPPSHNAGISMEHPENPEADEPAVTPLFQTQIPDDGASRASRAESRGRRGSSRAQQGGRSTAAGTSQSGTSSMSGHTSTMTTDSTGKPIKRKKKDFIKRNIQLASDAGNAIAMTDDEKKRLEDLLNDIEGIPDSTEEETESTSPKLFQVAVPSGDGFVPSTDERKKLLDIDYRLQQLMPAEDYQSIASASPRVNTSMSSMLFTRTNLSSLSAIPEGELGEFALQETKDQRHKQERLKKIEDELDQLTTAVESEMESPHLSEGQLNKLLDECAHTMSRATAETSSLAKSTGRSSTSSSLSNLYENPPSLPENVLQQLLADARMSSSGSHSAITGPSRRGDMMLESITEDSFRSLSRGSTSGLSRPTSRSSLTSRQQLAKDTNLNQKPSSPQKVHNLEEDKRPFLPKIDPLGRLSTQKLNNEAAPISRPSSKTVYTVRNSFSEQSNHQEEDSGNSESELSSNDVTPTASPHPPASGRKSINGGHQ